MKRIIALIGPAGAGKETILKLACVQYPQFHRICWDTSRPPREHEVEGLQYHFRTHDEMLQYYNEGHLIGLSIFNGYIYGINPKELKDDVINIGVFNITSLRLMQNNPEYEIKIIYLEVTDKERLLRQLTREQHPDVDRIVKRYLSDKDDFAVLPFYSKKYEKMPNMDLDDLQKIIDSIGDKFR